MTNAACPFILFQFNNQSGLIVSYRTVPYIFPPNISPVRYGLFCERDMVIRFGSTKCMVWFDKCIVRLADARYWRKSLDRYLMDLAAPTVSDLVDVFQTVSILCNPGVNSIYYFEPIARR
jgi:hypothetical protein